MLAPKLKLGARSVHPWSPKMECVTRAGCSVHQERNFVSLCLKALTKVQLKSRWISWALFWSKPHLSKVGDCCWGRARDLQGFRWVLVSLGRKKTKKGIFEITGRQVGKDGACKDFCGRSGDLDWFEGGIGTVRGSRRHKECHGNGGTEGWAVWALPSARGTSSKGDVGMGFGQFGGLVVGSSSLPHEPIEGRLLNPVTTMTKLSQTQFLFLINITAHLKSFFPTSPVQVIFLCCVVSQPFPSAFFRPRTALKGCLCSFSQIPVWNSLRSLWRPRLFPVLHSSLE